MVPLFRSLIQGNLDMDTPLSSRPPDTEASRAGHSLDRALRLEPAPGQPDRSTGRTSPEYWNMVGPFGGVTAATVLKAVLDHPERLGLPVALTVNFVAAIAEGAYAVEVRPVRTNRSTQHWVIEISQVDEAGVSHVVLTGTALTAVRRDTWSEAELGMPKVLPPTEVSRAASPAIEWFNRYELRPLVGNVPAQWDGSQHDSLSQLWVRDDPPRALDFPALAAMADIFFPRVWLRRAVHTPVGTVSLTVYFHADEAMLARAGTDCLLAQARGQGYFKGFHDQTAQLWSTGGDLLVTTHQAVYYKA